VKEMINLSLRSIFVHTSKAFLSCHKILRHRSNGFTPQQEGVLRILVVLRSRVGLKPRTLGPLASTLTITSPRTTNEELNNVQFYQILLGDMRNGDLNGRDHL
jgi:hypothetical protein